MTSKIDLRGVEGVPISGCPYQTNDRVVCMNHVEIDINDSSIQYLCVCDKDEAAPQSRGEHK